MKLAILSGAVLAAVTVPAIGHAQASPADQQAVDKRVAADRAAIRAAYATKDPKRIAEAKAHAQKDYVADWQADHPSGRDGDAAIRSADARLASDRAATKAAYATKDPKKIEEAKAVERKAYEEDWNAHHRKPG